MGVSIAMGVSKQLVGLFHGKSKKKKWMMTGGIPAFMDTFISLAFMVNKGELVDVVMNVEMTGFLRVMTMSWDARQVKVMLK